MEPERTAGQTGTIVHIGAGNCSELDAYLAMTPEQIVLVEPNTDEAAELERRTRRDSRIRVVAAAIAENTGEAVLNVFNFSDLSSLRQPRELTRIYPGLRLESRQPVETLSISDLLDQIELPETGPDTGENLLVIDAPGEEAALVEALARDGRLTAFQTVRLICGQGAYYEDSLPASDVQTRLEEIGYRIERDFSDVDPDWLNCQFRYMPLTLQLERMQSEMAALKAELAGARAQIEAAQTQVETEYQSRKKAEEALEADRAARVKLEAELDEQSELVKQATTALQLERSQAAEIQIELAEVKKHNETLHTDLSVVLRLQTVAKADFTDLQKRYGEMQKIKQAQDELLLRLTQTLGGVAEDLQRVEGTKPAVTKPAARAKRQPRSSPAKADQ